MFRFPLFNGFQVHLSLISLLADLVLDLVFLAQNSSLLFEV